MGVRGIVYFLGVILKTSSKENLAELEGDLQNVALPGQEVILV